MKGDYEEFHALRQRKNKAKQSQFAVFAQRLPRPFGPPKEIDGFCSGRLRLPQSLRSFAMTFVGFFLFYAS